MLYIFTWLLSAPLRECLLCEERAWSVHTQMPAAKTWLWLRIEACGAGDLAASCSSRHSPPACPAGSPRVPPPCTSWSGAFWAWLQKHTCPPGIFCQWCSPRGLGLPKAHRPCHCLRQGPEWAHHSLDSQAPPKGQCDPLFVLMAGNRDQPLKAADAFALGHKPLSLKPRSAHWPGCSWPPPHLLCLPPS